MKKQEFNKAYMVKRTPNCEDCKYGHFGSSGDGWNEPYELEFWCSKEDDLFEEEMNEAFEGDARRCSGFKPRVIESCSTCKKELNIPYYLAKYRYDYYGQLIFCSKNCLEEAIRKEREDPYL